MSYESEDVVGGGYLATGFSHKKAKKRSKKPSQKTTEEEVDSLHGTSTNAWAHSEPITEPITDTDNEVTSAADAPPSPEPQVRKPQATLAPPSARPRKHKQSLMVCTGGGPGLMEAANKGASLVPGAKNIGMGIALPFEAGLNPYVSPELAFEFHYFFTRKYWMLYPCRALVITPGGFGTMDELFELLTLKQTEKSRLMSQSFCLARITGTASSILTRW